VVVKDGLFRDEAERERAREERTLRYGEVKVGRPRTDRPGEYHAIVVPPEDYLDDEVLELFDTYWSDDPPGGVYTWHQARNFTAASFQWVCSLEGVPVPHADAVLAEIDLRSPGWPGPYWSEPRRLGPLA
jgi:hypothetical protein